MMAKKSDELSTAELVEELYSRLASLGDDVKSMTPRQREKFNDLSVRLFLMDSGRSVPDNNTARKQTIYDGFTSHLFLFDVTERALHEAGRSNSELRNKSELFRTLISRYVAKLHPRIWNDVASMQEYGGMLPKLPGAGENQ